VGQEEGLRFNTEQMLPGKNSNQMKKKLFVLSGIILLVVGVVLYLQARLAEDQPVIKRVMSDPDPSSPLHEAYLEAESLTTKHSSYLHASDPVSTLST